MKSILFIFCSFTFLCIPTIWLTAQNPLPPLNNPIVTNPNLSIPLAKREREIKQFMNDAYLGEKNPATSFVYSFIMPGLGEFYNEDVGLGFGLIGISIATDVGALLSNRGYEGLRYAAIGIGVAARLFSMIEAPIVSASINERRRNAIYELKSSGISLSSITPYYSPTNGTGLSLALSF